MRQTPDKLRELAARLKGKMNLRSLVLTLAVLVVFTTTYLLILPAFTLDKDEAAEQGGIDVVAIETAAEEAKEDAAVETADVKEEVTAETTEEADKTESEDVKEETSEKKAENKSEEKSDVKLLTNKTTINADQAKGDNFAVSAVVGKDAKVPADVTITATELDKTTDGFDYDQYKKDALKALKKDSSDVKAIKNIKFYDISLASESQEKAVEPEAKVNVKIAYEDGMKVDNADNIRIVHFAEQSNGTEKPVVLDTAENNVETATNASGSKVTEASFDTDGFSKYAVVEVETIEKTVITADGKTYKVSVSYGKDAQIPEGSTLEVKELTEAEATSYLETVANTFDRTTEELGYSKFFDITIKNGEEEVKIAAPVDVEIQLLDNDKLANDTQVLHFANENKADVVTGEVVGDTVKFEADGFSVYAIVDGDESNPLTYSYKYVFHDKDGNVYNFVNKDGETASYQRVGNNENLYNPGTPTDQVDGKQFMGWYEKNGNNWAESATLGVNDTSVQITGVTEFKTIDLYARYDDAYFLEYYDGTRGIVYKTEASIDGDFTLSSSKTASLMDGDSPRVGYQPDNSDLAFLGWSRTPDEGKSYSTDINKVVESVDFTGDTDGKIELYPVMAAVYWITFDKNDWVYTEAADGSYILVDGKYVYTDAEPAEGETRYTRTGTGATYVAPLWVLRTDSSVSQRHPNLPESTRPGYRFKGWLDENGNPFDTSIHLTHNITLTADWEATDTNYTVIFWRQNASDAVDATDAQKTYSYDHSDSREAKTGTSVKTTQQDRDGYGTGFKYNSNKSDTEVTIAADGSSVLNVYYDRQDYTLKFLRPGAGDGYVETTDNDGQQYGLIDGEYVELTRNGNSWTYTDYDYQEYNGREGYPQKYGYINGDWVEVEYDSGYWWYYSYGWHRYYDQVYSRTEKSVTYTGKRYKDSTVYVGNSAYHIDESLTIHELYGHKIADQFTGERWLDYLGTKYATDKVLVMIDIMPNANITFAYSSPGNRPTKHMYYMVEALPGATGTTSYSYGGVTRRFVEYTHKDARYNQVTKNEDFMDLEGFTQWTSNPEFNSSGIALDSSSKDGTIYMYYTRNSYNLEFWDSYDGKQIAGSNGYESVLYESPLRNYQNTVTIAGDSTTISYKGTTVSHEGYKFDGWYADPECTTPFDFTSANATMPSHAVRVYAKWTPLRFRVWVQPNGGELSSSESTYFRADWGELIQEYADVEQTGRNYYQDDAKGTYYYINLADPINFDGARVSYYVPISEASTAKEFFDKDGHLVATIDETKVNDGHKYVKQDGVYEFVGWYKVDLDDVSDTVNPPIHDNDKLESWSFNTPIKENTAIRAIWKRLGRFAARYDANMYAEDGTTIAVPAADGAVVPPDTEFAYGDLANGITGAAPTKVPEGYAFVGWRTPIGEIVQPNEIFTVYANYAVKNEDVHTEQDDYYWYTLTAVYKQIGTTSITYDANQGTGTLTDLGETQPTTKSLTVNGNTVSNIVVNSDVKLSSGDGFTRAGYALIGWNDDQTAASNGQVKFELGKTYAVGEDSTLYAVWQKMKLDINFYKYGESDNDPLKGVKFDLQKPNGSIVASDTSDANGKLEFTGLEPDVSSYSMKETTPSGFKALTGEFIVTYEPKKNADGSFVTEGEYVIGEATITYNGSEEGVITTKQIDGKEAAIIHNFRDTTDITLMKTDADGNKLPKSQFTIVDSNNQNAKYLDSETGDWKTIGDPNKQYWFEIKDGEIKIEGLPFGTYKLTEKSAPDGYVILENEIVFTVSEDGITVDNSAKDYANASGDKLSIINTAGKPLPHTGGIGTTIFYILGLILVIGCGVVLISRRRIGSDR